MEILRGVAGVLDDAIQLRPYDEGKDEPDDADDEIATQPENAYATCHGISIR